MKLLLFTLLLTSPPLYAVYKDTVGTDSVYDSGDASLMGPDGKSIKQEKPQIQKEEAQEAAMPDEPTTTEKKQKVENMYEDGR